MVLKGVARLKDACPCEPRIASRHSPQQLGHRNAELAAASGLQKTWFKLERHGGGDVFRERDDPDRRPAFVLGELFLDEGGCGLIRGKLELRAATQVLVPLVVGQKIGATDFGLHHHDFLQLLGDCHEVGPLGVAHLFVGRPVWARYERRNGALAGDSISLLRIVASEKPRHPKRPLTLVWRTRSGLWFFAFHVTLPCCRPAAGATPEYLASWFPASPSVLPWMPAFRQSKADVSRAFRDD